MRGKSAAMEMIPDASMGQTLASSDYIGAACLGFWVVIAFGVLFLGWFGIRPRKVFTAAAKSEMQRRSRSKSVSKKSSSHRSK
ncbi:hypothetical protein Y032_0181g856 [Ancylostoma ceylanicum]|uniref:Uncharacterized protein n=1 Tax=Ancylostoma ceylanicum TaxID=53326 RepID=A0A016ST86_9BILA|nr:hypothetical protein Y032_0181g856 [Ancylostoma ceylanicum]